MTFKKTLTLLLISLISLPSLSAPKESTPFFPEQKVALHRVNSLERLQVANQKKFKAVEIDLWFLDTDFFIGHERSEVNKNIKLDDFFKNAAKKNIFLWIDFKNLQIGNMLSARKKIKELANKYTFKNFVIESKRPWALTIFCQDDIQCILWTYEPPSFMKRVIFNITATIAYYSSNITATSHQSPDLPTDQEIKDSNSVTLFTLNDNHLIDHYESFKAVRLILTDNEDYYLQKTK